MSDEKSENRTLADLKERAQDRDGLEGQIIFKGDYESDDDE